MNTANGSSDRLESFYEEDNLISDVHAERHDGVHFAGIEGQGSDVHRFDASPAVGAAEKQSRSGELNPHYWRRHAGHTDGRLDMLFAPNITRMYVSPDEPEVPAEPISDSKKKTISAFQKVKLITAWAKKSKFLNTSSVLHSPLKSPNRGAKVASSTAEEEADSNVEVEETPADDGHALDRLRIASKKIGIAKKAFGKRPELKQSSFAKKLPINKALQRAAHRVTIVKAFEHNNLFSRLAAEAKGYMNSGSPTLTALKAILSSDRTNAEIIELTFDYPSLKAEVKAILKKEQKDRERRLMEERIKLALGGSRRPSRKSTLQRGTSMISDPLSKWSPVEIDEDERRRILGYGQSKEEFMESLGAKADVTANQVVVARLMQALSDLNNTDESEASKLLLLNFYKCFHPDSKFVDFWTIVYVMLIMYIASIGIYRTTFVEVPSNNCSIGFSAWDWFDFSVDAFFVVDVLLRSFLFGQVSNNASTWDSSDVVVEPSKVLVMYMRNGMLVDTITSVPIQWIVMFGVQSCNTSNSSQLLYLRLLRLYRLTRIYKLFQSYKIKSWLRYLKRRIGNNNILQMINLALVVISINHIWTCLSWLVQSSDSSVDPTSGLTGFEQYQVAIGLQLTASPFQQYSISFMVTLQIMFAIDPYNATTVPEAWFGVLTVCLSVIINATMLSKVIEIWETINRAQTERDNRINAVMEFLRSNGIDGMLRNDILDYFEFRYSNEHFDVEKKLLDELPTEMQSRVIHKIFPRALDSCYLFTGAGEGFIAQCVVRMARRPLRTMPGQVITAEGTLGSEMFLLKSGSAEVSVEDVGGKPRGLGLIGPGQCFGEISLWMESRRTATVTSLDYCQLFMLTREDLESVLDRFPEMAPSIATFAIAPILRTKELVPSMDGLTQYAAERIARRMAFNREDFADGEELCSYGKHATVAYVIRTGKIFSEVYQGRLEILHNDLRCVGFTEMLVGKPYQETVKAKGMVQAYKLTSSDVLELLGSSSESYVLEQVKQSAQKQFRKVKKAHIGMRWNLLLDSILSVFDVPDPTENGNMLQIMMGAIGQRSPRAR